MYIVLTTYLQAFSIILRLAYFPNESSERPIWAWKALIMCSTPLNTFLRGFVEANEVAVSTRTLEFMTNPWIQLETTHMYSDLFCWKFE